jgi:phosphate starvation-inducible protein PhoH
MIDRLLKIIYMETKKTKIEKKMGLEKRSCERYDLQLPVNIKWKNFSGKIIEDSTTCKNIKSRVFARGKVVRNIKEHKTAFGHGIMFMGYKFLRLEQ